MTEIFRIEMCDAGHRYAQYLQSTTQTGSDIEVEHWHPHFCPDCIKACRDHTRRTIGTWAKSEPVVADLGDELGLPTKRNFSGVKVGDLQVEADPGFYRRIIDALERKNS
jgi:hypothetical protein